eukprot:jgi/Botrbrau1/1880/Bobra.146_1s0066.1
MSASMLLQRCCRACPEAAVAGALLKSAAAGGFLKGLMRLLRKENAPARYEQHEPVVRRGLWQGLHLMAALGNELYLKQAVEEGIIPEMHLAFRSGNPEMQACAVRTATLLLPCEAARLQMRKDKVWQAHLVDLASSRDLEPLSCVAELVCEMISAGPSQLAEELISAGVLKRLKASRERVPAENFYDTFYLRLRAFIHFLDEWAEALKESRAEEVEEEPNLDPGASGVKLGSRRQKPTPEKARSGTTKGDSNSARSEQSAKSHAQGNGRQPGQKPSNTAEACSSSREEGAGLARKESAGKCKSSGKEAACAISIEAPPGKAQNEDAAKKVQRRKKAPTCAHCGKKGGEETQLRECARCRSVLYCGRACQTEHWPSHRAVCKAKAAAAKGAVAPGTSARP